MVREYKAINIEFSGFSSLIMNPKVWYEENFKEESRITHIYMEFLKNSKKYFNPSQHEAMEYVARMPDKGLSLIQGPPGTGKTHTIIGLISMAVA